MSNLNSTRQAAFLVRGVTETYLPEKVHRYRDDVQNELQDLLDACRELFESFGIESLQSGYFFVIEHLDRTQWEAMSQDVYEATKALPLLSR
jgi:hypothetical protein